MNQKRLIIDTDLGTDVDDCLALGLAVQSPELHLEAVCCVYADVDLRARMASKLLRLAGLEHIPVALGCSRPLLGRVPPFWKGHEGQGLLQPDDPEPMLDSRHAAIMTVELARRYPREVWLLAIGPLTDVAVALQLEPHLPDLLAGVVCMGATVRGPADGSPPAAEHNVRSDPEAAFIVFHSGLPLTVAPLDVTTQVVVNERGAERIAAAGSPFHLAVADQLRRYPPFGKRGWTYPHDPLALATLLQPELFTFGWHEIDVDLGGSAAAALTMARPIDPESSVRSVRVVVDVDRKDFEAFLIQRLSAPLLAGAIPGERD